jgi:hypothetical protein
MTVDDMIFSYDKSMLVVYDNTVEVERLTTFRGAGDTSDTSDTHRLSAWNFIEVRSHAISTAHMRLRPEYRTNASRRVLYISFFISRSI